jgi:hypothetical protein
MLLILLSCHGVTAVVALIRHLLWAPGIERCRQRSAARERLGWRVLEVVEVDDESCPSFPITLARRGELRAPRVAEGHRIVGERR